MKTLNKIFLMLAGTMFLFAACEDKIEERGASPVQTSGVQAFFPNTISSSLSFLPTDSTWFTIPVMRYNTKDAATLQLKVTDSKNILILDINNSVTFEAGQSSVDIRVDLSAMQLGQSTELALEITEPSDVYTYGESKVTVKVLRDYKWIDLGVAEFEDLFWTGTGKANVTVQQAEGLELFRLKEVYSEVFLAIDPADPDIEKCRGTYLQFYLDTTDIIGTDGEKYKSCEAVKLPSGFQDLGIGFYGYDFYWALPGQDYGRYCAFSNYGNIYTIKGIMAVNGSPAYMVTYKFTWKTGFPGEIPDPYKEEDLKDLKLEKTLTNAAGYYWGYENYSYYGSDEYGGDVPVFIGEYIVEMENEDMYLSLNILASFDGALAIPAGEYAIDASGKENSVRPGSYSEIPYGSYAEVPAINTKLYLVSGTVKIEYAGNTVTITVDAVTAKGSTVKTTWSGELAITDMTAEPEEAPAGTKAKVRAGLPHTKKVKLSLVK